MTNPVAEIIDSLEMVGGRDTKGKFAKGNTFYVRARVKEFDYQIRIYVSRDQLKRLKQKCKNGSMSELVRTYIEWGLENDK